MDDVDLTGVHPVRRDEIRRRVRLVRQYLTISRPTLQDDEQLAAEIGLSVTAAMRLVAAWREYGRASAMPGAQRTFRLPNRLHPRIAREVEFLIDEEIDRLGLHSRPADLVRAVNDRCDAEDLNSPNEQAITARLLRRRHEHTPAPGTAPTSLVVDHTAIALPVLDENGIRRFPILTFSALMPVGFVLGHRVEMLRPTPQVTASVLATSLAFASEGPTIPIEMAGDATPGWHALLHELAAAGVERRGRMAAPVPAVGAASLVFGDAVDRVRIRPRHTHRPAAIGAKTREGLMTPFTLLGAQEAVDDAITVHNRRRTQLSFSVTTSERLPPLRDWLAEFAINKPEEPRHRRPTSSI